MSKRWSPTRVATGGVLAAWALAFWFVLLTDRSSLYLSPRTAWVIPTGAILLSIAAFGRIISMRTSGPVERLSRHEAIVLGFFLLPVALIMILPPQTLSSYAVGRRPTFVTGVTTSVSDISTGPLTLLEIAGAQNTRRGLDALATHAGQDVDFTGFVTRTPTTPADEFSLNRFVISCCVADAQNAYVRVVDAPPGKFAINQWVRVKGTIYPIGRDVILQAASIVPVPKPAQPYLSP